MTLTEGANPTWRESRSRLARPRPPWVQVRQIRQKEYINIEPCDYEFPERFFVILSFTIGKPPGFVEPSESSQIMMDAIYTRLMGVRRTAPLLSPGDNSLS